jgi:tRNA-specific 2-thiouridylase
MTGTGDEPRHLLTARDQTKDQSYFLWTLTQSQLKHCLFPIGDLLKTEVRKMARTLGLPNATKPDSQGVCFIGEIDMHAFLAEHIPPRHGEIKTTSGKIIGTHDGVQFYTIGQRHGLEIGGGIPYYVASKDLATNILVVAEGPYDDALFSSVLVAEHANWISGAAPRFPARLTAKIRYRQPMQGVRIETTGSDTMRATFDEPQRAVTPGQSIVLYDSDTLVGGAIITN